MLSKIIVLCAVSLIVACGLYYVLAPSKVIKPQASHVLYNDVDTLTNFADLIIVGQPEKDFSEYTPTIKYTDTGRFEDFHTTTDIKVLKVLKGDYTLKSIPVDQHAALISYPFKLQKDLMISEDYSVMQKNNKYLLFLKKYESGYCIISINQGKFNVDNLDSNEKLIANQYKQYGELTQAVLSKYANKLN